MSSPLLFQLLPAGTLPCIRDHMETMGWVGRERGRDGEPNLVFDPPQGYYYVWAEDSVSEKLKKIKVIIIIVTNSLK